MRLPIDCYQYFVLLANAVTRSPFAPDQPWQTALLTQRTRLARNALDPFLISDDITYISYVADRHQPSRLRYEPSCS